MLILDIVAEEIACVEVLDRKDAREKLDGVLSLTFLDEIT